MSTRTASGSSTARTRSAPKGRRKPSRKLVLRRRLGWLLVVAAIAGGGIVAAHPWVDKAVQELRLPLRHEDIIRQQARDKGLDPALIAAVIYTESRFRDQTSRAGAKGLMQLMPATADFIAHKSGGVSFNQADLATPQVNIAYGSYYLRYLLDKYAGRETLALAAYNAGEGKVDQWYQAERNAGRDFSVDRIPFPETRHYVGSVLSTRQQYRREYRRELGL